MSPLMANGPFLVVISMCTLVQLYADDPTGTPVFRGPNETIHEIISTNLLEDGSILLETNRLTQLENGLNYLDEQSGQYLPAEEKIELANDGASAFAVKGQQKVIFSNNVNDPNGAIDLIGPDGHRIRASVLSLVYFDPITGNDVTLALAQDTPAELIPPNKIIFRNAFDNILADVTYTYRRSGIEQDVIIRQPLPDPANFGFAPDLAQVQVISEFFEVPAHHVNKRVRPLVEEEHLRALLAEPDWIDEEPDFTSFKIGQGRAFTVGGPPGAVHLSPKVEVAKRWWLLGNRYILAESIEYVDLLPLMDVFGAQNDPDKPQNPAESYGPLIATLLSPPSGTSERTFPRRSFASLPKQPITVAAAFQESPGVVLDYVTLSAGQASYTFAGSETYNITGDLTMMGSTVLEGGAVLKVSPGKKLRIEGTLECETGMFRPAVITSRNDNSVGQAVPSSTGTPAKGDYAIALELAPTPPTSSTYKLSGLRILFPQTAIHYVGPNGGQVEVWHSQAVKCVVGFSGAFNVTYKLRNVLANDFTSLLYASAGTFTVDAQNVTANVGNDLATSVSQGSFQNSVFTAITSLNFANRGTAKIEPSGGTIVFESVGAGAHYLLNSFRNTGTSSGIDPQLLKDLKLRTTAAPLIRSGNITANTTIYPRLIYDNDNAIDCGYHYDPLDECLSGTQLQNATLTVRGGASIGTYGSYGIRLKSGAKVVSEGLPASLNRFVYFTTVQEQPGTSWAPTATAPISLFDFTGSETIRPTMDFRFTFFSALGNVASRRYFVANGTYYILSSLTLKDSQMHNLYLYSMPFYSQPQQVFTFINNIFQRCTLNTTSGYSGDTSLFYLYYRNNRFTRCSISLGSNAGNTTWEIKDNFFNRTSHSASGSYSAGNNAYYNSSASLGGSGNVTLSASSGLDFQSGPLGEHYYPTTGIMLSTLRDAGSRTASAAGLAHHTVTADNIKDALPWVDIGYHSIAVDSQTLPFDNDYDQYADYSEDANGNSLVDGNERSWQIADPTWRPNAEPMGPSSRKTGLVISEIHYNPFSGSEFIEIYNSDIIEYNLAGYSLQNAGGSIYTFTLADSIQPNEYKAFPLPPESLPNGGGTIRLITKAGACVLEVSYNDSDPWPVAPDGYGHSLVLRSPSYGEADHRAWGSKRAVWWFPGRSRASRAH